MDSWSGPENSGRIAVERAIAEIRAGRPVVVRRGDRASIAFPVEAVDEEAARWIGQRAGRAARLILSWPRLHHLGLHGSEAGAVALPEVEPERIERLAIIAGTQADGPVAAIDPLEFAALDLCRLALILPSVVTFSAAEQNAAELGLLEVGADEIAGFRAGNRRLLRIVGRAPTPLEGAPNSEFVVFRGGEGLRDQAAVIIGAPDFSQPVTVRLHSACLTGDLFGSLKCDCGDQLRTTARYMAEHDGGVLLYLDQEGRGNGLGNKIRAYRLQAKGFDTYDADEALGFDDDQRGFAFAAEMLRQLGVTRVRILTNNPMKIAALEDAGLDVVSNHRILGRHNDHNRAYLEAKRDRAGHLIEFDADPPPTRNG